MDDLEISKRLALAIGWKPEDVNEAEDLVFMAVPTTGDCWTFQDFDYRDWSVIGPIAERYDFFPYLNTAGNWVVRYRKFACVCRTPQEAIAQAVIGAERKGG
jgi:hypothetical protein